jgi:hypothetical protein
MHGCVIRSFDALSLPVHVYSGQPVLTVQGRI